MNNGFEEFNEDEIVFNSKSHAPTATPSERRSFLNDGASDEILFTRKKKTLSPEKIKELEKIYQRVAVNDYGDEYHLSEEERKRKFRYYDVFGKVTKCKKKFRKLDEYVKVFRWCLDCLKVVAEDNGIYEPEKFVKLVLRNKIKVYGLQFPKYIGRDKKEINWEYISQFIMDYSQDPSLLSKHKKSALSDMDDDEAEEILFDKEQIDKIMDSINNPDDEIFMPYDEDDDKDTRDNIAVVAEKPDTKELIKFAPDIVRTIRDAIKEQRRLASSSRRMHSMIYEMTEEDFEYIQRMDKSRGYESDSDIPTFKGDIMKEKDYKRYLLALKTFEDNNFKVNVNGKMVTIAEAKEIELKDALESAGWNVRNLYKQKEKEKKLKKAYKKDKKREEELKRRLIEVQKRNDKRSKKTEVEFNSKKKKKDKKKKKKEYG